MSLKHKSFRDFQLNILRSIFVDRKINRRVSMMEYQYAIVTLLILWMISSFILPGEIDSIFSLFSTVATVKLAIWRMKDRWKNPWNLLWLLVPIINLFTAIRLLFYKGTQWPNQYWEDVSTEYKKEGWVKWYFWLIQIGIFLWLIAIIAVPIILGLWYLENNPDVAKELLNHLSWATTENNTSILQNILSWAANSTWK